MMLRFRILTLSMAMVASAALSLSSHARDMVNGVYQWEFLSGQAWPGGYNRNTGKPDALVWARDEYPADFFQRINNALPEAQVNEAFMVSDDKSNIHLTEDAEVFVTFIHEGAGYKNSFGYFTYDRNNPPTTREDIDVVIAFPNLSYPHLANGHRVSLGNFPAGTSIGFFIAANGFWWWTGVKDFQIPYYYSISALNPEQDATLKQHMVALYDEDINEVLLGFEDLPRTWGDNDFNDAVFSVKATPDSAIAQDDLVKVPDVNDSDADGLPDEQDEFPDDYRRAYSAFYPSSNDWVTLAFEDNYPSLGDYDMNDLVVRERFQTIYNAQGQISGFKLSGFIDARGASRQNGFAVRLMGMTPEQVEDAFIVIDGERYDKQLEQYQSEAVISLWRNSTGFTATGGEGKCSHFNTVPSCPKFDSVPYELDVTFTDPVTSLLHSNLDFFIYRTNDRGYETHMAGYPPTDLFYDWIFGKKADNSDPASGRYFKSTDNLPWALKLNSSWKHPREYIDVLWAYPAYEQWVESSGSQSQDWYLSNDRPHHVFEK